MKKFCLFLVAAGAALNSFAATADAQYRGRSGGGFSRGFGGYGGYSVRGFGFAPSYGYYAPQIVIAPPVVVQAAPLIQSAPAFVPPAAPAYAAPAYDVQPALSYAPSYGIQLAPAYDAGYGVGYGIRVRSLGVRHHGNRASVPAANVRRR